MTIKIHNETSINSWHVKTYKKNKVDVEEYICSNCNATTEPLLKIFFVDNEGYDQHINICKECMCKMHNIFVGLETKNDCER